MNFASLLVSGVVACCLLQDVVGVYVREGDNSVLHCRFPVPSSSSGASDDARAITSNSSFYWRLSTRRNVDNVAINNIVYGDRYRVELDVAGGRYDLYISGITYDQDNGGYLCSVRQPGSGKVLHQQSVNLTVLLPPEQPQIDAPSTAVVEDVEVKLRCSSRGGSPPPDIRWFQLPDTEGEELLPIESNVQLASARSFPTTATATLVPQRRHDAATFVCVVRNRAMPADQPSLNATVQLHVNYSPLVTFLPSAVARGQEGGSVQLRCLADAKPRVTSISWLRSGELVSNRSLLQLHELQVSDAGAYECVAQNSVGVRRSKLQLEVMYSPRVSVHPPLSDVRVGDHVQVTCHVDAQPPAEHVEWRHLDGGRAPIKGRVLRLDTVHASESGRYACVAVNSWTLSGSRTTARRSGNATALVLVRHAPGTASVRLVQSAAVEGRPMTLACVPEPAGHPAPQYRWWHGETPDTLVPLPSRAVNYSVASVRRDQQGVYTCQAHNKLGSGARGSRRVTVLRAPQFVIRNQQRLIHDTDTRDLKVKCSAVARPRASFVWLKDGVDIGQLASYGGLLRVVTEVHTPEHASSTAVSSQQDVEVISRLDFIGEQRIDNKLMMDDAGVYTCRVHNEAGTIESTTQLIIQHAPIVQHRYNRVAFNVGEPAVIKCRMRADPEPQFLWTFDGQLVGSRDDHFYSVKQRRLSSGGALAVYESSLSLRRVRDARDYGLYTCTARNRLGERSTELRLQTKSRPERPVRVRVHAAESRWLLLDWLPGFDGGFPDTRHVVSMVDERGHETQHVCDRRPPCNLSVLLPHTTYRLKVQAQNELGESVFSDQVQASTWLDASQLVSPRRVQFEPEAGLVVVHSDTPLINDALVAVTELKLVDDGNVWRRVNETVDLHDNRGVFQLDEQHQHQVSDVRVRLCMKNNVSVCGPAALAEIVAVGSIQQPVSAGISLTAIVAAVVCVVLVIALVLLVFVCCRRRGGGGARDKRVIKLDKQDSCRRSPLPTYYPPGVASMDEKTISTSPALANNKALMYGQHRSDGGVSAFPDKSVAVIGGDGSNHGGGSLNSQDSLWHVKSGSSSGGGGACDTAGVPLGLAPVYSLDAANYDPAHANYEPDAMMPSCAAGYADYGYCPSAVPSQQQAMMGPGGGGYPSAMYSPHPHDPHPQILQQQQHEAHYAGSAGLYQPYYSGGAYDAAAYGGPADVRKVGVPFDESVESGLSTPTPKNRRVIREVVV